MPHLVRRHIRQLTAEGEEPHGLVSVTNDGWFHGSSELDQHLITAAFRCVECRTPMVRSVNTGISAFIDGDGVIRDPDIFIDGDGKGRGYRNESGRWNKQLNCVLIDNVPLDSRRSLYVAGGDWFAGTCGFVCVGLMLGGLFRRRTPKAAQAAA